MLSAPAPILSRRPCAAIAFASLLALLASTALPAQTNSLAPTPETSMQLRNLIGDTVLNGQAYEYDRQLADTIGPRLTGSANYMRAAEWAQEKFKSLGLSNVHTEDWVIPATWEPEGAAAGHITSPVNHLLHIYSIGWSPSTPKQGVSGQVVYVPSIVPAELDKQKDKLKGSIVLLDEASFGEKPRFDQILVAIDRMRSFGITAILSPGGPNGTETLTSLNFSGTIDPTPEAQIGLEDASLIKRLLDHGPVSVEFSFTNKIRKDVKVPNVVAELPGTDLASEVVIIGAHLDSWQAGTGAQDNGTGVASVLEAARAIKALNHPPRRTIRFVLFGGEEEGLLGSTAYARAHLAEIPKIDTILITDTGAQPAKGWYLMGRDDAKDAVASLKPVLSGLGADATSSDTEFIFETDHAAMDVLGVPTLVLWNDTDKYFTLHHKASDTFDSIVQKDLTQGAAVTAVTAYAIANAKAPLGKHLSPDEVQAMLKKAGNLEEYEFLKKANSLP